MNITDRTRSVESNMARLFSIQKPFSEHLTKWEDAALPDKYDHNCFEYAGQPTGEEVRQALAYQKSIGAAFLKLEGNEPLADSFGLEPGVTLTMTLPAGETRWKTNPAVSFRMPGLSELEELEVRHFGPVYGEDFSRRNVRRLYQKLTYHGAYLQNALVGACYSFRRDGITCLDGLVVDLAHRYRYIATTLIDHIRQTQPGDILMLHADQEDTPKDMYLRLGFEIADSLYEYSRTDCSHWNP